jgi:hypothetical protein
MQLICPSPPGGFSPCRRITIVSRLVPLLFVETASRLQPLGNMHSTAEMAAQRNAGNNLDAVDMGTLSSRSLRIVMTYAIANITDISW